MLAGFGVAALLDLKVARKAPKVAFAALAALLVVNMVNLAVIDARYCAVDPGDTIRIAVARETGSTSLAFVMDGRRKWAVTNILSRAAWRFNRTPRSRRRFRRGRMPPFRSGTCRWVVS